MATQYLTGNDVYDSMFSGGWGKSARQTKNDYLQNQVESLVTEGTASAKQLAAQENATNKGASDTIYQAGQAASKPTLTQADIDTAFGQRADAAGQDYLSHLGNLQQVLGQAGVIGGGMGAALASQYDLARMGQITDATRSLLLEKVKTDAADRQRDFNNTLTYASSLKGPSLINQDWLQNILELRLGQQAVEAQRSAAKDAAKASRSAGLISGIGNVLGAAIPAIL